MATTKKSSKAKSRTAKKPTTKSAKATSRTKSTKAVRAKVKKVKKPVSKQLLSRLNLTSGLAALVLAGLAGYFMNHSSYHLFSSLLTKDELLSKTNTVFAPAIHNVYDVELRWVVVTILVLAAVVPLLAATRNRKQYEVSLAQKVMLWRWIDMAIVGALMVTTIALISGVQDVMTLKMVAGLVIISCALGWVAEKQAITLPKSQWPTYIISLVAGALPWLLIGVTAAGTWMYGMVRSPWFVYALYASTLIGFLAYVINQTNGFKSLQSYEKTERNSLVIGLLTKSAFAVILITGLMK